MLTRLGKRGGAGSWQRLMWVLTLPIVLLVAYSAFGQPKGKAKAKEDAKAKDAKADDDKAKKGKDAKEEEATPSDAGAPPAAPEDDDEPPPRPQTGDGGKLSPLNPEPDEISKIKKKLAEGLSPPATAKLRRSQAASTERQRMKKVEGAPNAVR